MTEETNNTPVQDTKTAAPESTTNAAKSSTQPAAPLETTESSSNPPLANDSTSKATSAPPKPSDSAPSPPPKSTVPTKASAPSNPNPNPNPKSKSKSKARRARPRRRGAGDSDSDDNAHSDNSLTSASASDSDTNDEDEEDEPKSTAKPTEKGKQPAAFPDSLSTTPAAWADEKVEGDDIAFSDFNAGKSKPKAEDKRVYTEEQTRRYEERKARMKEKQKARRAELKEAKKKERGEPKIDQLVASTSALASETPASQRGVELLPSRNRPDPKVTPRAGGFWTHDQRHDEFQESDFRGRGRGFRGRGRARGFSPVRGGFQGNRGQELTVEEPRGKKMSGEDGELEMDKLWAEMEAKERARAERVEREAQEEEERAEAKREAEAEQPRPNGVSKKDKWGHEAFESMSTVDQFQANRGFRGRGRGRVFAPPRGIHPFRGRVHPGFRPPFTPPTGPRGTPPAPPPGRQSPVQSSEATITQAGVDDLLAPPSQSVTVRLPGGVEQVVEPTPAPAPVPVRTPIPEFIPSANPSPVPVAVQQFTGSDHGSMSSGGPTTVPSYFPQGVVGPNGEVFNGDMRYYQRYHQQVPSGQFYPQSFSPDHFNGHSHHPSLGSRGSFSGPGYYQDGRASPFYAPSPMGQPNGFFAPPRSTKVSIRAPVGGSEETEGSKAERAAFRDRIQQQAYNPYASVNGYANGQNGVAHGQNGVAHGDGMNGDAVYYNQWQGPYVQGGYEFTEYGY